MGEIDQSGHESGGTEHLHHGQGVISQQAAAARLGGAEHRRPVNEKVAHGGENPGGDGGDGDVQRGLGIGAQTIENKGKTAE